MADLKCTIDMLFRVEGITPPMNLSQSPKIFMTACREIILGREGVKGEADIEIWFHSVGDARLMP